MNLESKSNKFAIVINEKAPNELEAIVEKIQVSNLFSFYALILHDKDTSDNGKVKTKHLHLYCEKTSQIACKTLLNELCTTLQLEKEQISIDKTNNNYLAIQYLTHKNDKSKHQYDYNLIVSSNYEELAKRYNKLYEAPKSEEDIANALFSCTTIKELVEEIGLANANKFQNLFAKIQKDNFERLDTKQIRSEYEKLKYAFIDVCEIITNSTDKLAYKQLETLLKDYDLNI